MRINVVTHNPGKVREYQAAFAGTGIEMVHVNREYDEIQTDSLEEVVRKGMAQLRDEGLEDFIVDDSGLFVDALKGFPGVYSSYGQKTIGNDGILKLMEGRTDRGAEFRCCIGASLGGKEIVVTGVCRGEILMCQKGEGGFGYDPIFSADGKRSFAEMDTEEKNRVSHRGNAFGLFRKALAEMGMLTSVRRLQGKERYAPALQKFVRCGHEVLEARQRRGLK